MNATFSGFEVVCIGAGVALVLHLIRVVIEERDQIAERDEADEAEGPVDEE